MSISASPNRSSPRRRQRPKAGLMIFEVLIALGFLAVVAGLAVSMHRTRMDYDRIAADRLRARLAGENIAQQLDSVSFDELSGSADELSQQTGAKIIVAPFETDNANGQHLTIETESIGGPVRHHYWRLETRE